MKKIITLITMLSLIFIFGSCNKNNNDNNKLNNYEKDYKIEIDDNTKKEIEDAYYNEFDSELKWCNPYEVDEFNSVDELNDYIKSHFGIRLYGIFNDVYLLVEFYGSEDPAHLDYLFKENEYALSYKNNVLISNTHDWSITYRHSYIYSNNNITRLDENCDISIVLNINENEANKIKLMNDSYNYTYFNKFMNDNDKTIQDAFFRIARSLLNNEEEINPKDSEESMDTTPIIE